jgi:hypothetical protein
MGRSFLSLFLDRTVEARRHEKPGASATGIIPGNRGKVGGNWCRQPLSDASRRQANITSSSGRRRSRSSYATKELCDETRLETAAESSQVRDQFRVPKPMQLPRGLWLLLYDQDAAQCSGGSTPPKGPARKAGRERDTVRRGAGESGKARKTS